LLISVLKAPKNSDREDLSSGKVRTRKKKLFLLKMDNKRIKRRGKEQEIIA